MWNPQDHWANVIFSDESRFNLGFNDGRGRVWRRNGDALDNENVAEVRRQGATSVMVWGCISMYGVGELVVIDGNMDHVQYIKILEENLRRSIENTFGDPNMPVVFQQDNAPAHRARPVERWFDESDIRVVQWPAQSPDLNPIENVWSMVSRDVRRDRPTNRSELIRSIYRSWGNITGPYLTKLYNSMPRRVRAVIRARGYATKY